MSVEIKISITFKIWYYLNLDYLLTIVCSYLLMSVYRVHVVPGCGHRVLFTATVDPVDGHATVPYGVIVDNAGQWWLHTTNGFKSVTRQSMHLKYHKANTELLAKKGGPHARLDMNVFHTIDPDVGDALELCATASTPEHGREAIKTYLNAARNALRLFDSCEGTVPGVVHRHPEEQLFLATQCHWEGETCTQLQADGLTSVAEAARSDGSDVCYSVDVFAMLQTSVGCDLIASRTLRLHRGRAYITSHEVEANWKRWALATYEGILRMIMRLVQAFGDSAANKLTAAQQQICNTSSTIRAFATMRRPRDATAVSQKSDLQLPPCLRSTGQHLGNSLRYQLSGEINALAREHGVKGRDILPHGWAAIALEGQRPNSIADFMKLLDAPGQKIWGSTKCSTVMSGKSALKCRGDPDECARRAGDPCPTIFQVATRGAIQSNQGGQWAAPLRRRVSVQQPTAPLEKTLPPAKKPRTDQTIPPGGARTAQCKA